MLTGRGVAELERDFLATIDRGNDLPRAAAERLRAYQAFVRKHSHHLARHPGALLALAHAQPLDNPVLADARQKSNAAPDRPWLRLLNPPGTDQNPALLRTIEVGSQVYALAY